MCIALCRFGYHLEKQILSILSNLSVEMKGVNLSAVLALVRSLEEESDSGELAHLFLWEQDGAGKLFFQRSRLLEGSLNKMIHLWKEHRTSVQKKGSSGVARFTILNSLGKLDIQRTTKDHGGELCSSKKIHF
jgi:hypothetical protein